MTVGKVRYSRQRERSVRRGQSRAGFLLWGVWRICAARLLHTQETGVRERATKKIKD